MAEEWRKITVSLRNGDLEAYINVPYLNSEGGPTSILTIDEARKALEEKGVVCGIQEETLERIFRESLFDEDVLVARGRPPQPGANGIIEYYFETDKEFNLREDKDGRIDYHEVSILVNVAKGDSLCRRRPPTIGIPGESVLSQPIKSSDGRDIILPQGPNTEISPKDPDLLIALQDGCVTLSGTKLVEVLPKLEIKGDVDFSTGNINFVGALVVGGDIKTGFKVKTTGDLEVGGSVEDAEIEAGGNVLVKKGFIGHGKGLIKAGGDLTLKFAQNENIYCAGNLILGGELLHCKTRVVGNVLTSGRKGAIIGGTLEVQGSVETNVLGGVNYTNTVVSVGCDFKNMERIQQIDTELAKITDNQDKVKKALYNLTRLKIKFQGKLPPEQEALLERIQETSRYYPKMRTDLLAEKNSLEASMAKHKNTYVKVSQTLYPGVKIVIGRFPRVFKEQVERATLREVKGEIVEMA